eukprot:TRINITY_DN6195_c0_g1_i3.p2 TRINITY_DN6195_c0_g1~~TRINITY_DN6195_c0_g1_i3.p2  ORF type:complete len:135 (+),score=15.20 TRINITY_DN6195_c0_g1_i3:802-1206(+)
MTCMHARCSQCIVTQVVRRKQLMYAYAFSVSICILANTTLDHSDTADACMQGPGQNRYSWDPMTTLLAVRGTDQFYNTVSGFNQLLSNGFNIWHNVSNTNQRYVNLKVDPSVVANTIDGLLTEAATGHVESLRR